MIMKKAQVSVEYLIILGLTITIILGAVYVFVDYLHGSGTQVISSRINSLGNRIVQQSESIYAVGDGSWIIIDIEYPDTIVEAYTVDYEVGGIPKSELVLVVRTPEGNSESVFFSDINITGVGPVTNQKRSLGNVREGKASIKIESRGDHILLNSS